MNNLILGFDDNLGLPEDFIKKSSLKTKSYHNLTDLLYDFEKNNVQLLFIPAGTLPYMSSGYHFIAQATFGPQRLPFLKTVWVARKQVTIPEAISAELGRVNQYCTTSFWAPLIYCMKNRPSSSAPDFINTDSFQDMLFKVASERITSATVWDIILDKNKEAASEVHPLAVIDKLPTPVIIAKSPLPQSLQDQLVEFKTTDKQSFFNGFSAPDINLINQFTQEIAAVIKYYNLNLSNTNSNQ